MTPALAPLAAADPQELEALLDAAFGRDRRARTAYRLREGVAAIAHLSFAAFEGRALVGSLQSWPLELASPRARVPLVLVGPVAVAPARQQDGIGRALMTHMLAAAETAGAPPLVMIGDPDYYGRFFGFAADATQGWSVPGPVERHRLLARASAPLPARGALGPRRAAIAA